MTLPSGLHEGMVGMKIVRVQPKPLSQRDPKIQWMEYDQSLFLSSRCRAWPILIPPLKPPTSNYSEGNSRLYIIFNSFIDRPYSSPV